MTIFLTDDNPADWQLFEETLQEIDHNSHFIKANSGRRKLDMLRTIYHTLLPDFIFIDVNMPAINGKEGLVALKQDARLKLIPVTILSTLSREKEVQKTMPTGAICYITNPLRLKLLKHILAIIINCLPLHLLEALQHISPGPNAHIVYHSFNRH